MEYKPILFNTEMVRAILEGRKTQTRRLVRKKYDNTDLVMFTNKYGTRLVERQNDAPPPRKYTDENGVQPCKPGDILWVRETWTKMPHYVYKADDERPEFWNYDDRWHPSILMPKEAARIFLRVKAVWVEQLNDMDEDAAIAEGFPDSPAGTTSPLERFATLWDKTIKRVDLKKYGWYANPWVWVIEFERCEKPEGWGK